MKDRIFSIDYYTHRDEKLRLGKYKGCKIESIIRNHPNYISILIDERIISLSESLNECLKNVNTAKDYARCNRLRRSCKRSRRAPIEWDEYTEYGPMPEII